MKLKLGLETVRQELRFFNEQLAAETAIREHVTDDLLRIVHSVLGRGIARLQFGLRE